MDTALSLVHMREVRLLQMEAGRLRRERRLLRSRVASLEREVDARARCRCEFLPDCNPNQDDLRPECNPDDDDFVRV